jgi:hypothetical protein
MASKSKPTVDTAVALRAALAAHCLAAFGSTIEDYGAAAAADQRRRFWACFHGRYDHSPSAFSDVGEAMASLYDSLDIK